MKIEEFLRKRRKDQKHKSIEKEKQKDLKSFRDKHNAAEKKAKEKTKLENLAVFKEQNRVSAQKSREKILKSLKNNTKPLTRN